MKADKSDNKKPLKMTKTCKIKELQVKIELEKKLKHLKADTETCLLMTDTTDIVLTITYNQPAEEKNSL